MEARSATGRAALRAGFRRAAALEREREKAAGVRTSGAFGGGFYAAPARPDRYSTCKGDGYVAFLRVGQGTSHDGVRAACFAPQAHAAVEPTDDLFLDGRLADM